MGSTNPARAAATGTQSDLFADHAATADAPGVEPLAGGAAVLRGFASAAADTLWLETGLVIDAAPLRRMVTPGGLQMSVAMTNCGALGWVSDRSGYRYEATDPHTGRPWPRMPKALQMLAQAAAAAAGFAGFDRMPA